MGWVDRHDQHIRVSQKSRHGNCSPNRCTSSEVTRGVPESTLSKSTPLCVFRPVSADRKARRANTEIASPRLLRSLVASSLAAASTPSSIARVVLIPKYLFSASCVNYLASDATENPK
jgi:hypothetical protein